jgi:thiamine-phosphate pyrophosphorylase
MRPRLYLVVDAGSATPSAAELEPALSAGDVAAVLFRGAAGGDRERVQEMIAIAQRHGAAALVDADIEAARSLGADGVHLDAASAAVGAVRQRSGDLIVGVGGLRSRHDAMTAGEAEADYVMFGRIDAPEADVSPRALEDAEWWAESFVLPAVLVGGPTLDGLDDWIAAGTEFIALEAAVWQSPDGAAAAVAAVNSAFDRHAEHSE